MFVYLLVTFVLSAQNDWKARNYQNIIPSKSVSFSPPPEKQTPGSQVRDSQDTKQQRLGDQQRETEYRTTSQSVSFSAGLRQPIVSLDPRRQENDYKKKCH